MKIKVIVSKDNQTYKYLKGLKKSANKNANHFLIEGKRLVNEALRGGFKLQYLIVHEDTALDPFADQDGEHEILKLDNKLFRELAETVHSQGIIAVVKKPLYQLDKIKTHNKSLILVANAIQDPGNLGTIIRIGAAAGIDGIILTEGTVDMYNAKVIRATMGSIFQLPVVEKVPDKEIIKWFKEKRISIAIADVNAARNYYSVNMNIPLALIIGNENKGPSELWKSAADINIKIPMIGRAESLNAAVAAGILTYEALRQRNLG